MTNSNNKNRSKHTILKIILLLALVGGGIYLFTHIKGCVADKKLGKLDTVYVPDMAGTKQWKDAYDALHARNEVLVIEKGKADITNKQKDRQLAARAADLRVAKNKIESMTDLLVQAKINVNTPLDTVMVKDFSGVEMPVPHFRYEDKYDTVEGWINEGQNLRKDVDIKLKITAPISLTVVNEKKWFLGRDHSFIDGKSENKNVTIPGIAHTEIKTPRRYMFWKGLAAGVLGAIIFNVHR